MASAYSVDTVLNLLTRTKVKTFCPLSLCFFLIHPLKFSHLPFVPDETINCRPPVLSTHPQSTLCCSELTPVRTPRCSCWSQWDSCTACGMNPFLPCQLGFPLHCVVLNMCVHLQHFWLCLNGRGFCQHLVSHVAKKKNPLKLI